MKKQILKSALLAMAGVGLLASGAMALPNYAPIQTILNDLTLPTVTNPSGNSSIVAANDYLTNDSYWSITASGGSVATLIIEVAGFSESNIFGIYNGTTMVDLFSGSASSGAQSIVSIKADGSVYVNFADTFKDFSGNLFGYYLKTPNGTFYSDTGKNEDSFDHMLAYQGNGSDLLQLPTLAAGIWTLNEYILAWEDLYNGGDQDYDDFVVMVESVNPVPEPATMLLFGTGLAGLAAVARRRKTQG